MKNTGILITCMLAGTLLHAKAEFTYEWRYEDGYAYWYENGIRQGTVDDPKGVKDTQYGQIVRGREIYDPDSDAWYWLDADHNGAKAVSKDVWMPYVYQNEKPGSTDGKWVRYDEYGRMIKGEQYDPVRNGWYYFDVITGMMCKGWAELNGNDVYYDPVTGKLTYGTFIADGIVYTAGFNAAIVECIIPDAQYYSQIDPRWASVVIGSGSIHDNGCSCCVATTIFNYYKGTSYTPVDVANLFHSWGHYNSSNGHGTDSGVWRLAAQHFDLTFHNSLSYEETCRQLLRGNMVSACVTNGIFVQGAWSHNILLLGLTQQKQTYVFDPLHPDRNGWYSVWDIYQQRSTDPVDCIDGGPWIALGKR